MMMLVKLDKWLTIGLIAVVLFVLMSPTFGSKATSQMEELGSIMYKQANSRGDPHQSGGWNFRGGSRSAPDGSWTYRWGVGTGPGGASYSFGSGSGRAVQKGGGGTRFGWGGGSTSSSGGSSSVYGGGGSFGYGYGGGGGRSCGDNIRRCRFCGGCPYNYAQTSQVYYCYKAS